MSADPSSPISAGKMGAIWGGIVVIAGAIWAVLYHYFEHPISADDFPELALALGPPVAAFAIAYLVQDWRLYHYRREHDARPSEFAPSTGRDGVADPNAPIAALGTRPQKPAGPVGRAILWGVFSLLALVMVGGLIAVGLEEIAPVFEQTTGFKAVLTVAILVSPFVGGTLGYRAQRRKNERITGARRTAKAPAPVASAANVYVPAGDRGPTAGAAVFVPEGDPGPTAEPAVFVPDDER